MKKVINDVFPFKGYLAITILWWIFIRRDLADKFTAVDENHETIHFWQLVGLALVAAACVLVGHILFGVSLGWLLLAPFAFYVVYGAWWLLTTKPSFYIETLKWYRTGKVGPKPENESYYKLPFEAEAYLNQSNFSYTSGLRKPLFSWVKFIGKSGK